MDQKNKEFKLELLGDYGQQVHCEMNDADLMYLINMMASGQLFMDLVEHLQKNRRRQYLKLLPLIQQASQQIVRGVGAVAQEIEELEDPDDIEDEDEDEEPLVGVIANE